MYGLTMVAVAVVFCVVWFYASSRGRLLGAEVDHATLSRTYRSYLLGPAVYGAAVVIALFAPFVSLCIYARARGVLAAARDGAAGLDGGTVYGCRHANALC